MSNPVLLRNVEHKDLKIIPGRGTQFGDSEMMCPTFPAEFRNVLAHYPIVFRETGDGQRYEPVALFGFQAGENLFASADAWDALYVPIAVARQPFLMSLAGDSLLVNIDLDHPKVSTTIGTPLFLEFGGNSDYLDHITDTLVSLHHGLQSNAAFVAALLGEGLIEPFTLKIELDDGSNNELHGLATINEDKLAALGGASLERLHRSGFLMATYLIVASLTKLRELIERKNQAMRAHG